MKNNTTEIVFILDRSGSMSGLESDTIGGFNSMIEKQKNEDGKCYVSTILFNNVSKVIHDRVLIDEVKPMTRSDYSVGGSTALLDAIGTAINHIETIHKYARKEDVPEHTIFVITTDGMENFSYKYHSKQIKKMIKNKQEECGWEFLFAAANIDAVETAESFGIRRDYAVNYHADKKGTDVVFNCFSGALSHVRKYGGIAHNWSEDITEDFQKRK